MPYLLPAVVILAIGALMAGIGGYLLGAPKDERDLLHNVITVSALVLGSFYVTVGVRVLFGF
jgi:hypothetical protein